MQFLEGVLVGLLVGLAVHYELYSILIRKNKDSKKREEVSQKIINELRKRLGENG